MISIKYMYSLLRKIFKFFRTAFHRFKVVRKTNSLLTTRSHFVFLKLLFIVLLQENQFYQRILKFFVRKQVPKCSGYHPLMAEILRHFLYMLSMVSLRKVGPKTFLIKEKIKIILHFYKIFNRLRRTSFMFLHGTVMDSAHQIKQAAQHQQVKLFVIKVKQSNGIYKLCSYMYTII